MRDYVSPAELKAYADLCKSVADADAARGAVGIGGASLPPPPPRTTLDLVDLVAAEAARERRDCEGAYSYVNPTNLEDKSETYGAVTLGGMTLFSSLTPVCGGLRRGRLAACRGFLCRGMFSFSNDASFYCATCALALLHFVD